MLPAGKTKKEIALKMASQGKTAEQIREDPCVNRKHSSWIEDADQIVARKYGIRGDADGQDRREDSE